MRAPGFVRAFVKVVAEKGVAECLKLFSPQVGLAYEFGAAFYKEWSAIATPAQINDEVLTLAAAPPDEVADAMVAEAGSRLSPDDLGTLKAWASGIPDAIRASLSRKDDPSGTSLPPGFAVRNGDDAVRLLPRPPRFKPDTPLPERKGWVLKKYLGGGGYGEVWLVENSHLELTGAVKFCHDHQGQDLRHETAVIARLMKAKSHPNIVRVLDICLEAEIPWLMYEYVPGGTLTNWIHQLQSLPIEERIERALAGLRQILDGVAFCHALAPAVIHRDLKPANILVDTNGTFRITDFGIGAVTAKVALLAEGRGQTERTGRLMTYLRGSHTPLYASPQQRNGADADPRDDVHAIGVIVYQMLTGEMTQGAGPDFADDLRDIGVRDSLIQLLGKCVAHKPDRRPVDAKEVCERLTQAMVPADPKTQPVPTPLPQPTAASGSSAELRIPATPVPPPPPPQTPESGKSIGKEFVLQLAANAGPQHTPESGIRLDPAALYAEGWKYFEGNGVIQSDEKAVGYFHAAAELGHALGQVSLGDMYWEGRGVPQDYQLASVWYLKAANQGEALGQVNVGYLYLEGYGLPQDYKRAAEWFGKAAGQGNADGQYNLGYMYETGTGVAQDFDHAAELYRRAAAQRHSVAITALQRMGDKSFLDDDFELTLDSASDFVVSDEVQSIFADDFELPVSPADDSEENEVQHDVPKSLASQLIETPTSVSTPQSANEYAITDSDHAYTAAAKYYYGRGVSQSYKLAASYYLIAANQGHKQAQNCLGFMHASGQGVVQDDALAIEWYHKSAAQEHARAQFNLGVMYRDGRGASQDVKLAASWLRKAAEQGHALAQAGLGKMYETGQGVRRDYKLAVKWYRSAAEQENAAAQHDLGSMYRDGRGVPQDYSRAVEWYQKAALQGESQARACLGAMYRDGRGVQQDDNTAIDLFRASADQGNAYGQACLGFMYETGRGVPQDHKLAVNWYRMAADQGNADAQANLGEMYETGKGVVANRDRAIELYQLAAAQGSTFAQKALTRLGEKW